MTSRQICGIVAALLLASGLAIAAGTAPGPFTVKADTRIVVDDHMQFIQSDIKPGKGWTSYWTNMEWSGNFTDLASVGYQYVMWPGAHPSHEGMLPAWSAVRFLSDAIFRMTGARPATAAGHDYPAANAIVLTTLGALKKGANVPADLLAKAKQALAVKDGAPLFSANEAYYIRTEGNAVYIIANQMQGLPHGVVELLLGDHARSPQYQVGYEKLSMGPSWTYVPDFSKKPLVFNMEYDGRPGMYARGLGPTRGSQVGATGATIPNRMIQAVAPQGMPAPDEPVELSDRDWQVGFRIDGSLSPGSQPSQNMESFHPMVAANMLATGSDKGFLCVTKLGLDAERPPATKALLDTLWLDTDPDGPNKGKIFWCTLEGAKDRQPYWMDRSRGSAAPLTAWCPPVIDMSVPAVRDMLLKDMIAKAENFWALHPGESWSYPHAEPSDGGLPDELFPKVTAYPNWYSDYRKAEGQPWGPYKLNGFYNGEPKQPTEGWWSTMTPPDVANAQADTVYALNNWLLREFDKYVQALPAEQQLSGGISKSKLIHTITFSYSAHDVPPNFNFDRRVRMSVSGYATHRGTGKWKSCQSFADVMRAMQVMLPECDMSQYWVYVVSYPGSDWGLRSVGEAGFLTPEEIYSQVHDNFYAVGGRNLAIECDEDHGKNGLTYYLYARLMWEPTMSLQQLTAYRDRWVKRAYGAAAFDAMRQYYDLMAPGNFVNSASYWGRAIQYIQQADAVTPAGTQEQRRLDELKQFWYYYHLQAQFMNWNGSYKIPVDPAVLDKVKEFLWKGQTSYIAPLYCFTWGLYRAMSNTDDIRSIFDVCAPTYYDKEKKFIAPAHYTEAETAAWWADVVKSYPAVSVTLFKESKLVNGAPGAAVDLNDLTTIREFKGKAPGGGVLTYMPHHADQPTPLIRASKDGDTIGLKVFSGLEATPRAFSVAYTVDQWDAKARAWKTNIFSNMAPSVNDGGAKSHEVATLTFSKTVAGGLYRFNVGSAAASGHVSSLDYDTGKNSFSGDAIMQGLTFTQRIGYADLSPQWYLYIPKGTKTLDVEIDDELAPKIVTLYTGLPSGAQPWKVSRTVDLRGRGTHRIPLQPGEDGSLLCLSQNSVNMPHFYSIPNIAALAPWMLMVPKAIARSDGLTGY